MTPIEIVDYFFLHFRYSLNASFINPMNKIGFYFIIKVLLVKELGFLFLEFYIYRSFSKITLQYTLQRLQAMVVKDATGDYLFIVEDIVIHTRKENSNEEN